MSTDINDYVTKTNTTPWKALVEDGIDTTGISVKVLRFDEKQQRPPTFMLRFDPGASYPYHNHPGGEEIFVLEGSCTIEGVTFTAGDYLYTPPGYKHSVSTQTGCTLFLIVPQEVEILR